MCGRKCIANKFIVENMPITVWLFYNLLCQVSAIRLSITACQSWYETLNCSEWWTVLFVCEQWNEVNLRRIMVDRNTWYIYIVLEAVITGIRRYFVSVSLRSFSQAIRVTIFLRLIFFFMVIYMWIRTKLSLSFDDSDYASYRLLHLNSSVLFTSMAIRALVVSLLLFLPYITMFLVWMLLSIPYTQSLMQNALWYSFRHTNTSTCRMLYF